MSLTADHLHAQFNRATIAEKDFAEAEEYLRAYSETLADAIQRALLSAAIVAYARPFKSSDTGGRSTPSLPSGATRSLGKEQRKLHQKLLAVRDKAVAHSSFSRKATGRAFGRKRGFVMWSKAFDVRGDVENVSEFMDLVTSLRNYCVATAHQLNRRLLDLE